MSLISVLIMSFGTFNSVWNFGLYCVTIYCSSLWFKSGELMSCLVQDSFVWHAFKREICLILCYLKTLSKASLWAEIWVWSEQWNSATFWLMAASRSFLRVLNVQFQLFHLKESTWLQVRMEPLPDTRWTAAPHPNGRPTLLHEDVFYYNIDWPGSHMNK